MAEIERHKCEEKAFSHVDEKVFALLVRSADSLGSFEAEGWNGARSIGKNPEHPTLSPKRVASDPTPLSTREHQESGFRMVEAVSAVHSSNQVEYTSFEFSLSRVMESMVPARSSSRLCQGIT